MNSILVFKGIFIELNIFNIDWPLLNDNFFENIPLRGWSSLNLRKVTKLLNQ